MTTEVTYIACDGTKFEERWKCEEYEKDLEIQGLKDTLFCFDEEGSPLSLNDMEAVADNVQYVVIKSEEAYRYFCNGLKELRYSYPNEEVSKSENWNISFVLDEGNTWVSCEAELIYLSNQIKTLQKYIDMTK